MTPKQVAEIVEFILQMQQLPETLAKLSEEGRVEVISQMEARKAELGL
ncbi:MAG TPA: hypothetical protein VK694_03925 [Verrucomicrobiae bacterium]|nr:hypothetical protein [Verrucomicrobiae bacterium]